MDGYTESRFDYALRGGVKMELALPKSMSAEREIAVSLAWDKRENIPRENCESYRCELI